MLLVKLVTQIGVLRVMGLSSTPIVSQGTQQINDSGVGMQLERSSMPVSQSQEVPGNSNSLLLDHQAGDLVDDLWPSVMGENLELAAMFDNEIYESGTPYHFFGLPPWSGSIAILLHISSFHIALTEWVKSCLCFFSFHLTQTKFIVHTDNCKYRFSHRTKSQILMIVSTLYTKGKLTRLLYSSQNESYAPLIPRQNCRRRRSAHFILHKLRIIPSNLQAYRFTHLAFPP